MVEPSPRKGPILCIVGARPNFMKIGPILAAFKARRDLPEVLLVHTGQHYDASMNDQLFRDLALPQPDVNLEVGSASHAVQTAEIMRRFEPVLDKFQPSCVLVVGDVNSTVACSLVAAKKGVPVVHVEAGLRSYDRKMPEEINRVVTDQLSDLLYTTERAAHANLAKEGIDPSRVQFVGNVMIDSLRAHRARAVPVAHTLRNAAVDPQFIGPEQAYGVVTLHRPSNVDNKESLQSIIEILVEVSTRLPLICPLHPRTRGNVEKFGLLPLWQRGRLALLPPQGYLEMLGLMSTAALVITDSGGIQEETTALAVPCLTVRENTERPITIEEGTNTLVKRDRIQIMRCVTDILETGGKRGRTPEYWDGKAAPRIAAHLAGWLAAESIQPRRRS